MNHTSVVCRPHGRRASNTTSSQAAWLHPALLGLALLTLGGAASRASAQGSVNFGLGMGLRLENSTNHDGDEALGQARLIVNAYLDSNVRGPYLLSLEQGTTVLATGTCDAGSVVYSGEEQEGTRFLRECSTANVATASIRTNAPVTVVIATVNEATDARTEVYRGEFPVFASWWWDRNDGDRPIHIEHRGLRLDSFFGAGFVRQYIADQLRFSYVDSAGAGDQLSDMSFRCRVGEGEWRVYAGSLWSQFEQNVRNRVWLDGTVHEDGLETLITRFYSFDTRSMPIAVQGSNVRPSAGSSMDGTWSCELRSGSAGARVVAREFRFEVLNGYIQHHALEAQLPAGRNSAMLSLGLNPAAMPVAFDPTLVRGAVAGRALTGATAPTLSPLPTRATNLALTMPRATPAARGGGGRGRRR
ncbi:MAG: hypothetical protein KC668_12210 [Myxococcales bacterium]|nr:hypothetical protein [Myxococcales bacterium]